jgi:hypothetical protein
MLFRWAGATLGQRTVGGLLEGPGSRWMKENINARVMTDNDSDMTWMARFRCCIYLKNYIVILSNGIVLVVLQARGKFKFAVPLDPGRVAFARSTSKAQNESPQAVNIKTQLALASHRTSAVLGPRFDSDLFTADKDIPLLWTSYFHFGRCNKLAV